MIKSIDDKTYETEMNEGYSVVKFYADWCGSCRMFAPKFKRLANNEEYKNVNFLEVNAEHNPAVRSTAEVTNLPYFAVYKDGKFVNGVSTAKEEALVEMINEGMA